MDTIGSRLCFLRESVEGLTPPKLGRLAGLASPSHVRMLENGERGSSISADAALSLSRVLGCTVEFLVRGEGEPPSVETINAAVERAKEEERADSTLRDEADDTSTEIVRPSQVA